MKSRSPQSHTFSAAQRGLVVQRVIVDGWSVRTAARAAGLPERLVAAWVADFRRAGMASLRGRSGRTVLADRVRRFFVDPALFVARIVARGLRWLLALDSPQSAPIRRWHDDRRGGPHR
jgi:hypothetical protein